MADLHPAYRLDHYLFRRKVLKLFGGAFHVYDRDGNVVFYSKLKAFKLKEDIRVYSDESESEELLRISARKVIDVSAAYDVVDSTTGEKVGALQRKGLKSILKDEYDILGPDDETLATIREDSWVAALFRRFVFAIFPQTYHIQPPGAEGDGAPVLATIRQSWNPFVLKYRFDLSGLPPDARVDRRLVVAAGVILAGIEGRQG